MEIIEFLLDYVVKHGDNAEHARALELKASLESLKDSVASATEVSADAS